VEPRITPEPSSEERAAILAALERLAADESGPPAYRSAWRDAGIRENYEDSADEAS
jgi:hypothetical protein